jgi:hypothetical protein
MRATFQFPVWIPPLVASVLVWPQAALGQAFTADYDLSRTAAFAADPATTGLSFAAGRNWFAQISVGQGLQHVSELRGAMASDPLRIGGGYRWSDGQSLSLHVTGRRAERLGLSVSYDWPRYFVRLSYDPGLNPVPQDRLRFSAGVRF